MAHCPTFVLTTLLVLFTSSGKAQTFSNPIMNQIAPDPQILRWQGNYYMVLSVAERDMVVYKSPVLTDFNDVPYKAIVRPDVNLFDACWAPELHEINGEVYCYFSMHRKGENDHRMWVTKAVDSSNLLGEWTAPVQLMPDEAEDANDGTVFKHPTNNWMYFVFTRTKAGVHDPSLYIAPMLDPYTVLTPRVLLRSPGKGEWDCKDACINEGAHVLTGVNNVSHLIFSGSFTWSPSYALGRMSIRPELDPLVPDNWEPAVGPVFASQPSQGVYGPGHAAFVLSPDGTETWMSYHAHNDSAANQNFRYPYLDKMAWDLMGYPVFPQAHGIGALMPVPSGQSF